jgi:NADH-quinone oxidoreductase subunit H
VFAVGSLAVYGIILGGWSANSKYSLLGALRSSAQIISYEIPLGMSVLGVFLVVGSLNLETIIEWQRQHTWFVFLQPLAFLLFMTSVFAECNRLPFDLPEAEQELVGGYHTEYSSLKFGMFFLGEYTHMITTSFLMAILFWGGWSFFGLENLSANATVAAVLKLTILLGKMGLFILLYLLVRWTIPRFRFDQLMNLAWKVMMPLSLAHLVGVMLILQFAPPDFGSGRWWPLVLMTLMSIGLFVGAGYLSATWRTSVTVPKRKVRKLPPGLPAGVTYASR